MNALMGPGMAMLGNQTMQQGLQHQGTATSLAMSQGGQTPGSLAVFFSHFQNLVLLCTHLSLRLFA